jgi:hypothetical protein
MDEAVRDVLELTKTKMREAGEYSREAYEEFIDESINYYLEKGRLSEEDDIDSIKEELSSIYEDIQSDEIEDNELEEDDFEEREEKKENLEEEKDEEDEI